MEKPLPETINRLLRVVSRHAHRARRQVFVVGGLLRDQRLDRATDDLDFVVDRAVHAFAQQIAIRLHGHAFVLDADRQVFRVAVKQGAVRYHLDFARQQGRTIEQDLARRDFTMNALAAPLNADVSLERLVQTTLDPYEGITDLQRRVIRHVSPSALREDPLRLLRAVRLGAELHATLHPTTARLIRQTASRLRRAAPERLHEELFKLLAVPDSAPWLRDMDRLGLLAVLFPEVAACRNIARRYYPKGGVLGHSLDAVELLETFCFDRLPRGVSPKGPPHPYPLPLSGGEGKGRPLTLSPLPQMGGGQRHTLCSSPPVRGERMKVRGDATGQELRELSSYSPQWRQDLQAYLDQAVGGNFPRRVLLKLAELLHDIAKPVTAKRIQGRLRFFGHEEVGAAMARKVMTRFRCSREETRVVELWVRHHLRLGNLAHQPQVTDRAIFRYFKDLDPEGVGMVLVSLADHWTYCPAPQRGKGKDPVERIAARLLQYYYYRPEVVRPIKLIDGHLVMRTFHLKEGPLIGQLLRAVQDAQAAGQVTTREEALAYLRDVAAKLHK